MLNKEELEPKEILYLYRKRNRLRQVDAAKDFGISPKIYRGWESGRRVPPDEVLVTARESISKTLYTKEEFVILRRRAGLSQKDLAQKLKCSRPWLSLMENGQFNPTRLIKYWFPLQEDSWHYKTWSHGPFGEEII